MTSEALARCELTNAQGRNITAIVKLPHKARSDIDICTAE
jgi:hypothetical protein